VSLLVRAQQVTELEGLFGGLRGDVERLFMQTPAVDQDDLNAELEHMHRHVKEQARRPGAPFFALAESFRKIGRA
jgi:hypothetical protein